MKKLKIEIEGIVPLLMHSNRLANPLDPDVKEYKKVSGKRKKTDEDHEWLAYNEWRMGLYLNEENDVILPDINIESCVVAGAKDARKGKQFQSGFVVPSAPKLKNPRTGRYYALDTIEGDANFYDTRAIKLQGSNTVMRTRPIFTEWSVEFDALFNENLIDKSDIIEALRVAGEQKGIGDYRPKFGKFKVNSIK